MNKLNLRNFSSKAQRAVSKHYSNEGNQLFKELLSDFTDEIKVFSTNFHFIDENELLGEMAYYLNYNGDYMARFDPSYDNDHDNDPIYDNEKLDRLPDYTQLSRYYITATNNLISKLLQRYESSRRYRHLPVNFKVLRFTDLKKSLLEIIKGYTDLDNSDLSITDTGNEYLVHFKLLSRKTPIDFIINKINSDLSDQAVLVTNGKIIQGGFLLGRSSLISNKNNCDYRFKIHVSDRLARRYKFNDVFIYFNKEDNSYYIENPDGEVYQDDELPNIFNLFTTNKNVDSNLRIGKYLNRNRVYYNNALRNILPSNRAASDLLLKLGALDIDDANLIDAENEDLIEEISHYNNTPLLVFEYTFNGNHEFIVLDMSPEVRFHVAISFADYYVDIIRGTNEISYKAYTNSSNRKWLDNNQRPLQKYKKNKKGYFVTYY